MDERLRDFVERWVVEHRDSLLAGRSQDFAMDEVIDEVPELQTEQLVPLAFELLDILSAAVADLPSIETSIVLWVGSFAEMVTDPPNRAALTLEPYAVQLHATPADAGTVREMEYYERPLDWFGSAFDARYQVARPVGPEFEHWEYNALILIRRT